MTANVIKHLNCKSNSSDWKLIQKYVSNSSYMKEK